MDTALLTALRAEETRLLAELRETAAFRRLSAVREMLALYRRFGPGAAVARDARSEPEGVLFGPADAVGAGEDAPRRPAAEPTAGRIALAAAFLRADRATAGPE